MSLNYVEKGIIDINGICDPTTLDLDAYPYWTQISIPETLVVPEQKPDIEQVNSVNATVEIVRTKVIVTPTSVGPNEEGKFVTGRKLIVEGNIVQGVSYTALEPQQSVHSAHFSVPFSSFIVIPETILIDGADVDTLLINFQINSCIEDIYVESFCARQIFKNVTLLLQAVPAAVIVCSDC